MDNKKIYKVRVILFLAILIFNISFAQKGRDNNLVSQILPVYIETHTFPTDLSYVCYLSYRIPFSNLLFVREGEQYSSGYTLSFELYKKDKFIKRFFVKEKVLTKKYSNTLSSSLYDNGVTSFEMSEGDYLIKPVLSLSNTDIEVKIEPIKLRIDSAQVLKPIFVKTMMKCESSKYQLANFQSHLPYSENKFNLLLPIISSEERPVNISILQGGKTILEEKITKYEKLNPIILECDEKVSIGRNSELPLVNFAKIDFVNKKLMEGKFEIKVKVGEKKKVFNSVVVWHNKPKSLGDVEKAIEYLEIIGYKKEADSLSKFSDEQQYQALFNFWKKFDDDTTTTFNAVFDEFYSRIDVAQKKFNSLNKKDALATDRGLTYILYGKPDSVKRTFNNIYDVIEVWEYKSMNKKIYFSDKTGTGKFERMK